MRGGLSTTWLCSCLHLLAGPARRMPQIPKANGELKGTGDGGSRQFRLASVVYSIIFSEKGGGTGLS